jgi:hypothetical protein
MRLNIFSLKEPVSACSIAATPCSYLPSSRGLWDTSFSRCIQGLMFIAIAFLPACGPRYETVKLYTPPEAMVGQDCLEAVEDARYACEEEALAKTASCVSEAKREGRKLYQEALLDHKQDLEDYYAAKQKYEQTRAKYEDCLARSDTPAFDFGCYQYEQIMKNLEATSDEPERLNEVDFVDMDHCQGVQYTELATCEREYDSLYQRCGGLVKSETRCVARCD